MSRIQLFPMLFLSAAIGMPALADQIPYPKAGTIAPETLTYATGNGIDIFYLGSTAGFEDQIEVYDVQTGYSSGKILDNKTTTQGTEFSVGTGAGQINTGDQLIFYIDSPAGKFASVASYSADNTNHAYVTGFSGGSVNYQLIPAGLFVGMEDLAAANNSDWNYNDDDFAFTGVKATSTAATPEPRSLVLLATGLLGLFGAALLKKQNQL